VTVANPLVTQIYHPGAWDFCIFMMTDFVVTFYGILDEEKGHEFSLISYSVIEWVGDVDD
jgi:hypothetical protein